MAGQSAEYLDDSMAACWVYSMVELMGIEMAETLGSPMVESMAVLSESSMVDETVDLKAGGLVGLWVAMSAAVTVCTMADSKVVMMDVWKDVTTAELWDELTANSLAVAMADSLDSQRAELLAANWATSSAASMDIRWAVQSVEALAKSMDDQMVGQKADMMAASSGAHWAYHSVDSKDGL